MQCVSLYSLETSENKFMHIFTGMKFMVKVSMIFVGKYMFSEMKINHKGKKYFGVIINVNF